MSDKVRDILENLSEQVATHMMNMNLAPELTKDLVINAENQSLSQLTTLIEGAIPEKKYVNPKNTEPDFYAKDEGYNQCLSDIRTNLKELGL